VLSGASKSATRNAADVAAGSNAVKGELRGGIVRALVLNQGHFFETIFAVMSGVTDYPR
jgi:hypothetical protein